MDKQYIYALSTVDNPYDPFDQFSEWYDYDKEKGYNCCEYLGRVMPDVSGLTTFEEETIKKGYIEDLMAADPLNVYILVSREIDETFYEDVDVN